MPGNCPTPRECANFLPSRPISSDSKFTSITINQEVSSSQNARAKCVRILRCFWAQCSTEWLLASDTIIFVFLRKKDPIKTYFYLRIISALHSIKILPFHNYSLCVAIFECTELTNKYSMLESCCSRRCLVLVDKRSMKVPGFFSGGFNASYFQTWSYSSHTHDHNFMGTQASVWLLVCWDFVNSWGIQGLGKSQ